MAGLKSLLSVEEFQNCLSNYDWGKVYLSVPLGFVENRNPATHVSICTTASGIANYTNYFNYCGGFDNISYSLKNHVFKIDRYTINCNDFDNFLKVEQEVNFEQSPIHWIYSEESLLNIYPGLKNHLTKRVLASLGYILMNRNYE